MVGFRQHAWLLKNELAKRGRSIEWLEFDEEGHGFRKPENVRVFYEKLEAFFAKNLAPRVTVEPAAKSQ